MGRIEHTLLVGDKQPNRPKTAARNNMVSQESNEHIIPPQGKLGGWARRRSLEAF
jgi:hypothetical protein